MDRYDVAVVGAGAAGMMCASVAAQRGRSVVLIDHAERLAEKIRISGGGRCNFTNLRTAPENFLSRNPHFCRSALARYTPHDFLELVRKHHITYHEKHKGQLFCDESSERIIAMLRSECDAGGVRWRMPCRIERVGHRQDGYLIEMDGGSLAARKLVIATGGPSIPQIGATDFGYRIARQFGLRIVEPQPALVPLKFDAANWKPFVELAGISVDVEVACNEGRFREDLLFTHRGLSGPAILQISSYWNPGDMLRIDLAPGICFEAELLSAKSRSRQTLANVLAGLLPRRLAEGWLAARSTSGQRRIAECSNEFLRELAGSLQPWLLVPSGSEGWRKAEVTRGGVDTDELSQSSLEARGQPGLHFVGEVVDVTGWLGGYNFQWAWASAQAAGRAL